MLPIVQGGNLIDMIQSKLDIINSAIDAKKATESLEKALNTLKELSRKSSTPIEAESKDSFQTILGCRSIQDIEIKVPEFDYNEDERKVKCLVCNEEFSYDSSLERNSMEKNLSRQFRNLKSHLSEHLKQSNKHITALSKANNKMKLELKEELRMVKVGMNINRLVYYLLKKGRPRSDITDLISISAKNQCDVGDLNHSKAYVYTYGKVLAKVIRGRLKAHLGRPLKATGRRPRVKILADKFTHMHITRQVIQ